MLFQQKRLAQVFTGRRTPAVAILDVLARANYALSYCGKLPKQLASRRPSRWPAISSLTRVSATCAADELPSASGKYFMQTAETAFQGYLKSVDLVSSNMLRLAGWKSRVNEASRSYSVRICDV